VKRRKPGMNNPKLYTGAIEVFAEQLVILNKSEMPPFEIDDRVDTNEDTRLKYRYIDLRKPVLQSNLIVRHKIKKIVHDYFDSNNFLDIETPMLTKSTPEGARDYLVPSRIHPGKFYALPQSPQIFKQLLMISGFDRYYQIARCFRDEDLRADRQPEFTQVDVEMSFIDEEDIINLIEGLIKKLWKEILSIDVKTPFQRIPYDEAVEKYGIDRPDTRFGLELIDVTEIASKSGFKVFTDTINSGGIVKCINIPECKFSRNDIDALIEFAVQQGAKGMAWMRMGEKLESSVVKFFDENLQNELIMRTNAKKGDLILFIADKKSLSNSALAALRLEIGRRLNLFDNSKYNFLWVVDFPLFELDSEDNVAAVHHPFTSPKGDLSLLDSEPLKLKAKAYDIVLNGTEIGGGSIRIHSPEIQAKIFKCLGISDEKAKEKFGFLIDAFRFGAPPHGGIALGLDRLVALITKSESIREVIAFPKTKAAESLMDNSPNEVDDAQLREVHIALDFVKAKAKDELFEKIVDALNKEKILYKILEHKAVYTSQEAAQVRGTQLKQGAKALVCKLEKGFIQAVISAAKELDTEKLKKILDVKNIALASADDVKKIAGISIGAVPPFGNLFGVHVYLDKSIMENDEVAFNAGLHTKSIIMKATDLLKITGGKIGEFSK